MSSKKSSKKSIKPARKNKSEKILEPEENNTGSTNDLHPAFCFKHLQVGYSLDDYKDDKIKAIFVTKMQHLSQTPWSEIQGNPRSKSGHEKIAQDSIQVPIPANTPPDREFLSFRMGGGRNSVFIGYRKHKIFYIVWIDPFGKVYSHV